MGGPANILVIEDDSGIRDSIAECLEDEGYRVAYARDGAEGLRRVLEQQPDLIVCDLQMPVMSGHQFLDRLRATPRFERIPVVLMTGTTPAPGRPFPVVDAVLPKPFELEELLDTVRRLSVAS